MSNRRVPIAQGGNRLSEISNSASSTLSYRKESQRERAFIKERKPTHSLLLKLPLDLHQKLREIAFKTEDKITPLIIRAIEEYIRK